MCATYILGVHRGQKKASNPLIGDRLIQTVVSCHVSTGKQTHILCKSSKGSFHCLVSPDPALFFEAKFMDVCLCVGVCTHVWFIQSPEEDGRHCGVRAQEAVNQTVWVLGTRL